LISIGALRIQKNHQYLLEAFKLLKEDNIELHIYGMGPLQQSLQKTIDETGVHIRLKGQVQHMHEILPRYDLFVMSSTFEGFSLGVLETMAAKVPMLLSDIVSFREQCEDTAWYFSLDDVNDFASKVRLLAANKELRMQLSDQAYKRVMSQFTLQHHMEQLRQIYIQTINNEQ
jgi:glycosyltransferase involved in cell wall biosynthesis